MRSALTCSTPRSPKVARRRLPSKMHYNMEHTMATSLVQHMLAIPDVLASASG
jgi:hypothetical protein